MGIFISFDFDRTLADYSRAHGNSILEGIHETYNNKFQVNWFDIDNRGFTDYQIITNLVHNHGISFHKIFNLMDLCVATINQKYDQYSYDYPINLFDQVDNLLHKLYLKDNVVMGISTGNIKSINLKKIKETGIDKYFSFGSFGDEVFNRYQLLKLTRNRLRRTYGLSESDITMHVGDSVLDILSAKKSGFIPIGVATGNYSLEQLRLAGAEFVFNDIAEFGKSVDKILETVLDNNSIMPLLSKSKRKY